MAEEFDKLTPEEEPPQETDAPEEPQVREAAEEKEPPGRAGSALSGWSPSVRRSSPPRAASPT